MIRNATPADFPAILQLNLELEHLLSPMDRKLLEHLHAQAAYHRVLCIDGQVVAFVLAFREGAEYDSLNYQWFSARYPSFLYIDRIAVSSAFQGRGLGRELYRDLFQFARETGVPRVTCEYYTEPLNEASSRFHAAFGFREVGTQWIAHYGKRVSLQVAEPALA